ncbi:helix-turn-helix domain-containing protein [Candidatus Woesearchaeota archaeon]|nr:helix-turn-helix domain-containing protein [Candidatus Woesearchaeota archaeon]
MLTDKEMEILRLRQQGLKQTEIAKKLNITQPAISKFEANIQKKIEGATRLVKEVKKLGIKLEL